MPTRFYFQGTGTPAISPAYNTAGDYNVSNWNDTSGAVRRTMKTTKQNIANTIFSESSNSDSGSYRVLLAQFVSDPLAEQTLGGTVSGWIGTRESNTAADMFVYSILKQVSSTGTLKAVLAVASDSSGSEFTTSTNYVARNLFRQTTTVTMISADIADGDRLVYEVGYKREATVTNSYTGYIRVSDNQASDVTSNGASTTSADTWMEFSETVYMQGDTDAPVATTVLPSSASASGGGLAWSGLDSVYTINGTAAQSATTSGFGTGMQPTESLNVTNFGLSIPTANTIEGVSAIVVMNSTHSNYPVDLINGQILYSGSTVGSSRVAGGYQYCLNDIWYRVGIGGKAEKWNLGGTLTPTYVNNSTFGIRLNFHAYNASFLGSSAVRVDAVYLMVSHRPPDNESPELTAGPTVSYGSWTRTGPNNTPITVSFTYTDAEETASNELDYTIDTAAAGGGTEAGSGSMSSGVEKTHSLAYNASGLASGSNTLYVHVTDGTTFSPDNPSFTVLRDDAAPDIGTITVFPDVVEPA